MFTIAARAAVAITLSITAAVSAPSSDTTPTELASPAPQPQVLHSSSTPEPTPHTPTENELRTTTLKIYLAKHNSPMSENAADFIDAANVHGLEWHLLPSISGVESTFGKHVPKNSYNPFGWANGEKGFSNWKEAIYVVAEGVERIYYKKGRTTPELMHKIYAPPSPTWGSKVRYFMNKIEADHQQTLDSHGLPNSSKIEQ